MQEITLELFLEREAKHPGRRCFAQHSGIGQGRDNPYFRLPFPNGIKPVFETQTGLRLRGGDGPDNWYCYLNADADLETARRWEASQGSRVFLRDCLSCSVALDHNFTDNTSGIHTPIGQLEYDAKNNHDQGAVVALVRHLADAIRSLPFYSATKLITAVPARPQKTTPDLPTEIAKQLAATLGLADLTPCLRYGGAKGQVKDLPLDQRWPAWVNAQLSLTQEGASLLKDQPIILIDDKYQSGVSVNFVAMILQRYGASEVYGLYAVKTLRDNDNC